MKYFKNSDIAKRYNISEKTVRNWIEAAEGHKIDLTLFEKNNKAYIADNLHNSQVLEVMVRQGRKYRNQRSHKILKPSQEFYTYFNRSQIMDIMNKLEILRELPWDYTYFGPGAQYWDEYLFKLHEAGVGNLLTNTIEVLKLNYNYVDTLIAPYEYVNAVNLCIGNCLNARDFLEHLKKGGKLQRFLAIDISPNMLEISANNVNSWFGGKIKTETLVKDITHERFGASLAFGNASSITNVILLIAGPIMNFKEPQQVLHTIRNSMSKDDLLVLTFKRDTKEARRFFDFNTASDKKLLNHHDGLLLNLLNINDKLYEIEQLYDEQQKMRCIKVRLKFDISIFFEVEGFEKTIELSKGECISLLRVWHYTDLKMAQLLESAGFSQIHTSRSSDQELALYISRVKTHED